MPPEPHLTFPLRLDMTQGCLWRGDQVIPLRPRVQGHPLRGLVQELGGRGQGSELRLEFLSAADVAAYVTGRLGGPGLAYPFCPAM